MTSRRHFTVGVILNVWQGDNVNDVRSSLQSILDQTFKPDDVLIVADGPISADLMTFFNEHQTEIRFLRAGDRPSGLAVARNFGIRHLTTDYIMVQDADDISHPQRLEIFHRLLSASHIAPDLVSSGMLEFDSKTSEICGFRDAPDAEKPMSEQLRWRNTINHPTVFFNRVSMVKNGTYQVLSKLEDYLTWAILSRDPDFVFGIVDVPLVAFRVTPQYLRRRGGFDLVKSELHLQKELRSILPRKPSATSKIARIAYTAMPSRMRKNLSGILLSKRHSTRWEDIHQFTSDDMMSKARLIIIPSISE